MKKILLSVLALLAFAGSGFSQNLPSYVPTNGLVGWWPFNGNANDESGNNNNGTVNGATLTTDRFGNAGKAYSFNGTSQNILLGDIAAMEGNSHSISVWVSVNQFNPIYTDIITKEGTVISQKQWVLHFENDKIRNAVFTINNEYTFNSNQSLIPLNWFHIVKTWNSTESKTYINSELDSTISTDGSIIQANHNIAVGGNSFPTHYLNGKVDDIIFYNRALSQQEITGLYQGANTTTNCPTFPASLTQGLVGYWPFCGNANDESGNGNNGTVNGATLTTDRFGNAGSAYTFQNSSISLPTTLQQSYGDQNQAQFTFSCWFKNDDSVFIQPSSIVGGRNSNGSNYTGLHPWPGTKRIRWYVNSATTNLAESNSPNLKFENITVWNHVLGTFTGGTTPKLQLFYNGILVDTASFQVPLPWIQTNQFNLGIDAFYPRYYTGQLDDIAIWNRALTPQEIKQVYNQGICQTSITVTDTLLIHTGITSYNPVAYGNTVKVWPNPGNQDITLDAGNLNSMQGWKYKVANTLGQTVVNETAISQQQTMIDLSNWGGNGIYYLHLINPQGHAIEIKKIVLAP